MKPWIWLLTVAAAMLILAALAVKVDEVELERVRITGTEEKVFDWSKDACEMVDLPDSPARAFRNASGNVVLLSPHYVNRSMVGRRLGRVRPRCRVILNSTLDADPARFDDKSWITATYSRDGTTVFALVHQEYQGSTHQGRCPSGDYRKCWYNSITLATSHDGGATFTHAAPPNHLVASVPYRYQPDAGPYGLFQPSNIVLNPKDGYFYVFVRAEDFGAQPRGSCLLRTRRLRDPGSWRAWDGSGFNVRFMNPYRAAKAPAAVSNHLCTPVAPDRISAMTESLTYNTYFRKFMLVGIASAGGARVGKQVSGFYFSLSDDLLHWRPRRLLAQVELPWTYRCGDRNPLLHPSVLDPDSRTRNFLTVDRRAYLYFVRFNYAGCRATADRDLVRVPIEFSR